MQIKIKITTLLQIFCEFMVNFKLFSKKISKVQTTLVKKISRHERVKKLFPREEVKLMNYNCHD